MQKPQATIFVKLILALQLGVIFCSTISFGQSTNNSKLNQSLTSKRNTVQAKISSPIRTPVFSPSLNVVKGGFGVFEQMFVLTGNYNNVWEDVQITVTYTAPDATQIVGGGFHYDGTIWKSRVAPNMAGNWTWSASIVENGGTPTMDTGGFTVVKQISPGFIKRRQNTLRWINDNGTPFNPLGIGDCVYNRWNGIDFNTIYLGIDGGITLPDPPLPGSPEPLGSTWGTPSTYASAYGNGTAESANFNVFRVSPANCAISIFTLIELNGNVYDKVNSIRYDTLITTMKSKGFRIFFAIFNRSDVYNSSPAYLMQYEKAVKYIVDRYGAYVDFWDLVNEGDDYANDDFLNAIGAYVKTADPYDHPVTSSFSPGSQTQHDFTQADFTSPHVYASESEYDSDTFIADIINSYKPLNKPILFGESGNSVVNVDPTSALRMRLRSWTAFFDEGALLFWNASYLQGIFGDINSPSNQYIGPTERNFMRHLQNYTSYFPAAESSALPVSDPTKIRGYRLSAAATYGVYIHAFTEHEMLTTDKIITIAPQFTGNAAWINPSTGERIGEKFSVSAGTRDIPVPGFKTDIALKISCSTCPID
ncbi:MAG: DUF5060 domain-containing protein [Tatlockia sp.]|jgi:hypothetical protein|nr:DUF5060 domain-containing protein [Tatlockia sp.]